MFFGTYSGQLDQQKRICIPSDFRKILVERLEPGQDSVYLKAYGGGVEVYPPWEMAAIYEEFKQKSILDPHNRDEMSEVAKDFYRQKFDTKNGRLKIPEGLLKTVLIGKEIVFEGGGRFFRVRAEAKSPRAG
ncbi:MAG: hypothetical protein JSU72_13780 [Deltaproteobacteria bacterium]|nr:MAG: hypothetical protein JSU72_13780 [Deltaproteobacteria bacterium]